MSAGALSRELGVPQSTLSRWLREAANVGMAGGTDGGAPLSRTRGSKSWTAAEKLRVLNALSGMDEGAAGEFLRREGLHAERVAQWREEALQGLSTTRAEKASAGDRKRIKELQRELGRMEKALAEAAALLVLRKKLEALHWYEDAAPGETSERGSSPRSSKR
jgi:DNA-binding transcriptional MerR regulator